MVLDSGERDRPRGDLPRHHRQLRLQHNQGAIEQIDAFRREWNSERFLSYRLAIYTALRDGADSAHLPDGATLNIGNFWEAIATLARAGHLDRRVIRDNYGAFCQLWWAILGPTALRERAEGDQALYENLEWLAHEMHELDRRAGSTATYDVAQITPTLDSWIVRAREALQVEQSLRTVIIASTEPVTASSDIVPAAPPATSSAATG